MDEMHNLVGGLAKQAYESETLDNPMRATYIQRCEQRIKDAEETLKRYQRIKELLTKHPDLEEILTLIGRVNI